MSEENKNSLFREKAVAQISSPESMDNYLRVTSPGVWALLAAVIVLLIGACVWGIFGRLETHVQAAVVTQEGETYCLVPQEALDSVVKNPEITVDGQTLKLQPAALTPQGISEDTNVYILLAGNYSYGDVVYAIPAKDADTVLADTDPYMESDDTVIYSATIITETISPMSLLFN